MSRQCRRVIRGAVPSRWTSCSSGGRSDRQTSSCWSCSCSSCTQHCSTVIDRVSAGELCVAAGSMRRRASANIPATTAAATGHSLVLRAGERWAFRLHLMALPPVVLSGGSLPEICALVIAPPRFQRFHVRDCIVLPDRGHPAEAAARPHGSLRRPCQGLERRVVAPLLVAVSTGRWAGRCGGGGTAVVCLLLRASR
jgi:hypothetical protein